MGATPGVPNVHKLDETVGYRRPFCCCRCRWSLRRARCLPSAALRQHQAAIMCDLMWVTGRMNARRASGSVQRTTCGMKQQGYGTVGNALEGELARSSSGPSRPWHRLLLLLLRQLHDCELQRIGVRGRWEGAIGDVALRALQGHLLIQPHVVEPDLARLLVVARQARSQD